jgi:hypothetical protein
MNPYTSYIPYISIYLLVTLAVVYFFKNVIRETYDDVFGYVIDLGSEQRIEKFEVLGEPVIEEDQDEKGDITSPSDFFKPTELHGKLSNFSIKPNMLKSGKTYDFLPQDIIKTVNENVDPYDTSLYHKVDENLGSFKTTSKIDSPLNKYI